MTLLSNFAFNFNLRHYTERLTEKYGTADIYLKVGRCRSTPD